MSGGSFDYKQYSWDDVADQIATYVNGQQFCDDEDREYVLEQLKHDIERWNDDNDKERYNYIKENGHGVPNEWGYSEETLEEFRKGIELIRKAQVYATRIDYLMSGDDSEESFRRRLKEELSKLK